MRSNPIRWICAIALGLVINPTAQARDWSCGSKIVFNCDTHIGTAGGITTPIDCGKSTPRHFSGHLGREKPGAGKPWKCLKGRPMVSLNYPADRLVYFHAPCKLNGHERLPKGQNQNFEHSGCVNVSNEMLQLLIRCPGAPYEIQYASKPADNGRHYANSPSGSSRYSGRAVQ